jgi:hypothetical protein
MTFLQAGQFAPLSLVFGSVLNHVKAAVAVDLASVLVLGFATERLLLPLQSLQVGHLSWT